MMLSPLAFWILYFGIGAVFGASLCWSWNNPRCPSRGEFITMTLIGAAFWIPALCLFGIFAPLGWFAENVLPVIGAWMAKPLCKKQ